ncbi:hypothetical protein F5J12DRAFT_830713 [Pisolithus orientalis]|uniref:uncharacterized protein n=1 Tax=Pisolithus orientalis TaxID=936130 RepID=UPI002225B5F4|nr:uncharacterized protein F5J12DRAFT_830713 [Pisolithus orientalis]KAI6007790.1 hypothetical protein F5J12DRAFT_830713 [Pisolithus orientalis]
MSTEAADGQSSSSPSTTGNAGTSANAPNAPRRPPTHVPFISLYRPPPGQPPTTTDERCLFYCTQSALHRAQHKPPTCRSICLRRVYPFEVEVRTSTSAPTELQPQQKPHETRIWNPGLYVWTSTSARAARDKIETMAMDLGKEHAWTQKRQEWVKRREVALREHMRSKNAVVRDERVVLDDGIEITKSGQIEGTMFSPVPSRSHSSLHPLSSTDSSLLTPLLAPLQSLSEPIGNLLNPASHALAHLRRALSDGSLYSFGERAWEKAWTPEPLMLAMKVVERVWKKEGGEGGEDVDG